MTRQLYIIKIIRVTMQNIAIFYWESVCLQWVSKGIWRTRDQDDHRAVFGIVVGDIEASQVV